MSIVSHTLPASWYQRADVYQLERKGVFEKVWYLLGPLTKFHEIGTEVRYELAQVTMLVRRVSAAPRDVQVFGEDSSEMRSHITRTGLLFAAASRNAPPFDEFYPKLESLISKVDFTRLPHRRSIEYNVKCNWKTMVDGYQECLHCQYTHPSFSMYYPPTFYCVFNHENYSQHVADPKKTDDGLFLYFFPICTLSVYGGGMHSFRICPTSDPGVTRMEFDYYHLDQGTKFKEYFEFTRVVADEDMELCEKAQVNLESGVYNVGILNPEKESGVSFYQQRVYDLICRQLELERPPIVTAHEDDLVAGTVTSS